MKSGDIIKISKAARPHVAGGFRSSTNVLPEESWTAQIRKITKTKIGRKVHFINIHGGLGHGGAIMIDALPDFMTVEVLA